MNEFCYLNMAKRFWSDGTGGASSQEVTLLEGTLCRVLGEAGREAVYLQPADDEKPHLWCAMAREHVTFVNEMQFIALAAAGQIPDGAFEE